MSIVRKKTKLHSLDDLSVALEKLMLALSKEHEDDAVTELQRIKDGLTDCTPESPELNKHLDAIQEAFDGAHELIAYTFYTPKAGAAWNIAEELYLASTDVLNIIQRFKKA